MKKIKILTVWFILILMLLGSVPSFAAAQVTIKAVETEGFTLEFDPQNDYYLCYPKRFSGLKFTAITPSVKNATVSISIERFLDSTVSGEVGKELDLSYGRAKVTLTVTHPSDATNTKSYLIVLTDPKQADYTYAYRKDVTKVYKSAKAEETNLLATLRKGTTYSSMPLCIGTEGAFTKIVIPSAYSAYHMQVGYVKTEDLVEQYEATTTPYEYKDAVKALKKKYPNWSFEYRYMGTSLKEYGNTIVSLYKNYTGKKVSLDTVIKEMNPANFLDEKNIFMFLDTRDYAAKNFTKKGMESLWQELKGAVCTEAEAVEYFTEVGKSLKVNPYFLLARGVLETGHGTSKLACGIAGTDGKLYYNFFGIRAYDKDPANGAVYAQNRNWNSPKRSIIEGANWIYDQYILRGQYTPYFFRYYPYYTHLYMTDLKAPQKDAANIYTCYKGAGDLADAKHFVIPVFDRPYPDVDEKDWFYEDVYRATALKLFEGMEDGSFRPEETFTRAQMITVLARLSGENFSKESTAAFTDVVKKNWFFRAVSWGYNKGIVKGQSETEFAPEAPITREELCTMLSRFADYMQVKMKTKKNDFTDAATISKWAKTPVSRCVGEGLVSGFPGGEFRPKESANRAQAAKILSLFKQNLLSSSDAVQAES